MTDLPPNIDDLTPEMARNAPAGPEADRLCANARGWRCTAENKDAQITKWGRDTEVRTVGWTGNPTPVPDSLQASRTAEGAHRLREYLRERGFYYEMRTTTGTTTDGEMVVMAAMRFDDRVGARVHAPNEHLATARLLLLLIAEGVIEPGGVRE